MSKKPQVVFLVGATASGKTTLSVELAKQFPIEIINADSMQVFRELDIGTAKPSKEVQTQVPHHLIDILDPDQDFTAQDFKRAAEEKVAEIRKRKKIPVFVGGAGFYLKAISNPVVDLPPGTQQIQDYEKAHAELVKKDPAAAKKIHPNDHYRLSRALFLLEQGIIPSEAFQTDTNTDIPFDITWIGISWDRKILRERIAERVRLMFDAGIVEETQNVLWRYPKSVTRLGKTIGYAECLQVLNQQITPEQAIEQAIIRTGQYAKRQDTWFRKNPSIIWSKWEHALEHFSISIKDLIKV